MRKYSPMHSIGALLLLLGLAGCAVAVTQSVSVDQIPATIRALPAYAPFWPSGVAFFKGKLYVSTNIGLLAINGASPETLYTWIPRDDVVSGPWVDVANDALWIYHNNDNYFRRFDGTSWRVVRAPVYRSGRRITIVHAIGSPAAFWIVVGGRAWRYKGGEPPWVLEPRPPAPDPERSETEAVVPLSASMLYVVREDWTDIWPTRYAVYDRENNWARQLLSEKMQLPSQFKGAVMTPEGTYIFARDGRLFLIGPKEVQILETPGRCEAIAQTSTGKLLASFVDRGIFLLENGRWDLKAAYPYGKEEGERWAYLAESNGQIAYATTVLRQRQAGKYAGSAAIWVLRAGKLERVVLN